jgi:hypothetical protein
MAHRDRTGWLGMKDSNSRIRTQTMPLKCPGNFRQFGENRALETFHAQGANNAHAAQRRFADDYMASIQNSNESPLIFSAESDKSSGNELRTASFSRVARLLLLNN